ncbi:hypothetical protein ATO12_15925 [Aquimarina atlantica]|uniref:Uncharacterized protein n=1 Tax=Aquimarina atlantica TaxID=1317122 RepID=A0A023BTT8_9FLAO|nr:hypothetical protein [Aquimarina atlantica]EZH73427.1 hypothetical protein ATO12_15925 [Aquimarina atlantica]
MNKHLKEISVRGRYAIGLSCIKLLLRERNLHHSEFSRTLFRKLGEFTQAKKLDVWEEEVKAYLPYNETSDETISDLQKFNTFCKEYNSSIDKNWYKGVSLEILEASFYDELIEFYKKPENRTIKKVAELCESIGRAEMYGAMSKGNSKLTLKYSNEILEITGLVSEFDFQKIAKEYPFSKGDGWGKTFNIKTFKRK